MTPNELRSLADECLDWYWQHGHQRTDKYEISRGSCLAPLYVLRDQAAAIERSGLSPKPCMALWGPSQTGKSTLISGYLDVDGDERGIQSAMTWSPAEPVRFCGELKNDGSNTVINPYNGGADGSGCISRFVMMDAVPDPAFPVEITLATDTQILHALAAGYESECEARNKQGEEVSWGADNFRALLENVKVSGASDREGFESLYRLAIVLELLIRAGARRYVNLTTQWDRTLRPLLLNHPHLANKKALRDFTHELLWDSWPSLTTLCDRLQKKRSQLASLWGGGPTMRCSWRLAALLLDIDAYKHYDKSERVKAFVDNLSFRLAADGSSVSLGTGLERPLVQNREDFGLFQGLVWELRLPLRRDVLVRRTPVVAAFLDKADLMDFPGVSNEHEGAKKITNDILAVQLERGLTEVLKRGKTASIVVSRTAELDIDGFSILARAGKHPGQPKQLVSGIRSWMNAFGQNWPPHGRAMPLNLVITFCAKLINDVCCGGIRNGLDSYFSLFNKLADLADPRVVHMFTTTYPWLMEGAIHSSFSAEKKREKVTEILADRAFNERFGDNHESFEQMVANGGTDYFFRRLTEQAAGSRRAALLAQRLRESGERLRELLIPHIPAKDSAQDERNRALDTWVKGMKELLQEKPRDENDRDPAVALSRALRRFINIEPDALEALPLRAIQQGTNLRVFVDKQFRSWRASRANWAAVHELGLRDAAHMQHVLGALIEATNLDEVVKYMRENLGSIAERREAQECRRFVAVKMNRELLSPASSTQPHDSKDGGARLALLHRMAIAEDEQSYQPQTSPHFLNVIEPLFKRIDSIKKMQAGQRPPQAGDKELSDLLSQARP